MTDEGYLQSLQVIPVPPWLPVCTSVLIGLRPMPVSFRRSRQRNPPVDTRWQAADGMLAMCERRHLRVQGEDHCTAATCVTSVSLGLRGKAPSRGERCALPLVQRLEGAGLAEERDEDQLLRSSINLAGTVRPRCNSGPRYARRRRSKSCSAGLCKSCPTRDTYIQNPAPFQPVTSARMHAQAVPKSHHKKRH